MPTAANRCSRCAAGYGYEERRQISKSFKMGEGLVGQCAKEKKRILLTEVPSDYVRINSGLGASAPLNIIVMPVLFEGSVRAVIELASFSPFSITHQAFLDQLPESIGLVLNTIEADTLTENLLVQSQSLAEELRSQQEELRESNADLERQARLLAEQNIEAERKNQQVEQSKLLLEEKAGELAISSKYKSEFIANMSHELRTPLNSLLLLAQQLEDNPDKNMTATQVEYASVIHASGNDLLELLNSILDLAKVESGTVTADMADVSVDELRTTLIREFEHVAQANGLAYSIDITPKSPRVIVTDPQRLRQILKNLLANAFKFTEAGTVHMQIGTTDTGWNHDITPLVQAEAVIAFAVTDTGIGIQADQQQQIFEAFAQGDGTTARLYGGTGLGLSISRELVNLLGGELTVTSTPGRGSTFTVYLPAGRVAALAALPDAGVPASEPLSPSQQARATTSGVLPQPAGSSGYADGAIEGTKILVVDDDFRNIFAMSALLERGHAEVTVAESGADAIAALLRAPDFDIVLMDIMMPVMDGYETIRAIRAIEQFQDLSIIAVTGKVIPGERQRCLDAGANDYVPKPVDTAELLAALRPWLPTRAGTHPRAGHRRRLAGRAQRRTGPTRRVQSARARSDRGNADPAGRRRFPQHLRDVGAPRTRPRRCHRRRERRRRDRRVATGAQDRRRADGHHDAGHGRIRDDPCHPRPRRLREPPHHRGDGQGHRR